jgi:hypothetical protein
MSVRFWLSLVVSSALSASVLADEPKQQKKVPAQAPPAGLHVTCDFIEISATKSKTPAMDPRLGPVERRLKKAPISAQWNDFKQLTQATKKLEKKKTEAIALKQGAAAATLVEFVDKSKARLTVTIDNAKGKQVLNQTTLLELGDYVIHAVVLPPNDDGHLLAVTCK